jgi:hypothetical protein
LNCGVFGPAPEVRCKSTRRAHIAFKRHAARDLTALGGRRCSSGPNSAPHVIEDGGDHRTERRIEYAVARALVPHAPQPPSRPTAKRAHGSEIGTEYKAISNVLYGSCRTSEEGTRVINIYGSWTANRSNPGLAPTESPAPILPSAVRNITTDRRRPERPRLECNGAAPVHARTAHVRAFLHNQDPSRHPRATSVPSPCLWLVAHVL